MFSSRSISRWLFSGLSFLVAATLASGQDLTFVWPKSPEANAEAYMAWVGGTAPVRPMLATAVS